MNRKLYALLLEDVPKDAELLKEQLSDEGFDMRVDVVDTESAYVSCLKSHTYDIIFADFTLPGFNGQEALELAKRICPYVPFICISGTIGEDRAVELLKQGATDYVLKDRMERLPFATKRALDAVAQLSRFRKTEIELQTNRKLLQTIINNAIDAIYIKDLEGKYILVNEASEKAIGKPSEEIIGKNDTFFFPAMESQWIMALDKKVIGSGISQTVEVVVTLADGNNHIFSSIKCPMFDDFGRPNGLFGIARDITEYKQAEKKLNEAQEQYRLIFNTSIDAILLCTLEGEILSANPSACNVFGWTEEEMCKLRREAIVDASDPRVVTALEERARTGKVSTELTMIRKDGSTFPAEITSSIFTDKEGRYKTGMIIRDVTEHKKKDKQLILAKEKAEESDRLKTAFLHNISHEIRTPMNAIVGFSGFLNDPDLDPEKRKQFTDIIIQSSDQLLSIITDIISVSSIEAGQEKIVEKEIDLDFTLGQLYDQFQLAAKNRNVELNLVPAPAAVEGNVLSDGIKLVQIVSNLIVNALKFTKQGYINFGYVVKNDMIEFFVEDTGIGIPPGMCTEVFKRFRQVENGESRQFGGSGLGLSISKAYVEMLGGKIWVNSELGKGSTFYFTIPYKSQKKHTCLECQIQSRLPIETTKTKTLLIAEDEESNFLFLKELLKDLNVNIIRAVNGLEAVETCKINRNIDLVLMDIKMPVMDGCEATGLIRNFMPFLPIIAQTAYSTDVDKNRVLACGRNDFMSKPIKRDLLISKIEKQLCRG